MAPLERDEFIGHMDLIHDGLKSLDGRVGHVEQAVAVLTDRSDLIQAEATAQAKTTAGRWGMSLAGVGALAELFHRLWK